MVSDSWNTCLTLQDLYTVDRGLQGQNILQSCVSDYTYLLKINSSDIHNIAMSLYDSDAGIRILQCHECITVWLLIKI